MDHIKQQLLADKLVGRYVAIEGIDGAGKTTVCDMLTKWAESMQLPITRFREPGSTKFAEQMRGLLKAGACNGMPDEEFLLMTAARCSTLREVMRSGRAAGMASLLLADRCFVSSLAYQAYASADSVQDAISRVDRYYAVTMMMLPSFALPDYIVYLRINETTRVKNEDAIESRGAEFRARVVQGYGQAGRKLKVNFLSVDAETPNPEVTFERVLDALYMALVK